MTIRYLGNGQFTCTSGDTKPVTAVANSEIFETNTNKKFFYDTASASWVQYTFPLLNTYRVFKVGSTTNVVNKDNRVVGSGTDTADVLNAILATTGTNAAYEFRWDAVDFVLTSPIIWPTVSTVVPKYIRMVGGFPSWSRTTTGTGATRLLADVNWPTDRYFFELNNPSLLNIGGFVHIENFQGYLGNVVQGTSNVGFLKLESGELNLGRMYHVVKNVAFDYLWRGIHIKGMTWWGLFENIKTHNSSVGWEGDAQFVIEDGGIQGEINPSPKASIFQNIAATTGAGELNSYFHIRDHGYGVFRDILIDGKHFKDAPINIDGNLGVSKNYFENVATLDLEDSAADTNVATLWMHGNGVYDNTFKQCHFSNYPEAVLLDGAEVQYNRIEVDAVWGTAMTRVTDTNADPSNTIYVYGGANPGITNTKITHTGGTSRVIDDRRGAFKRGATSVADGGTISHGIFSTPVYVRLQTTVSGEFATPSSIGATTFTVNIKTHDNSPGTTQTVYWEASAYH